VKKFGFEEFKKTRKTKKGHPFGWLLISRKSGAQAAGLDFAAFFIFAAVFCV